MGDGHAEWRMRVQHVLSGERRYFRDWPSLERYLLEKGEDLDSEESK